MCGLFLGENRHKSCGEPEKEDARSDETNSYTPLEYGRGVGRRRELRHRSFQVHGDDNDIQSVENHTASGERGSEKQHRWVGSQRSASKQGQREHAANEDFGGEEGAQSSRKCVGELASDRHIAQPKSPIAKERPK